MPRGNDQEEHPAKEFLRIYLIGRADDMKETKLRVQHSEIIGYYQLIEEKLKGICAMLLPEQGKDWFDRLKDFDLDSLGKLIKQLRGVQEAVGFEWFSEKDFEELDELRKSRNYWCHQCFVGNAPIVFHKGSIRHPEHAVRLNEDYEQAVSWDERLAEMGRTIMRTNNGFANRN